jgi:hypothetical protein
MILKLRRSKRTRKSRKNRTLIKKKKVSQKKHLRLNKGTLRKKMLKVRKKRRSSVKKLKSKHRPYRRRKKNITRKEEAHMFTGTKLIAFYLPQYHRIPENDIWWGEGFTEWTNTRKAQPLFHEHYQPREPYQDYYYDLTDPTARKWQAEIARKYGIYGFCYYHYWFKDRMLLQTPFNEVLRTGEPDFPFCLSWANEPWTRTWDGLEHNVLMPQDYGTEQDWKAHFDYLLPAFLDIRYIRVYNKPLFIIYRPQDIPRCEEMLNYWQGLAINSGLKGIYFAETLGSPSPLPDIGGFEASIEFEPMFTVSHDLTQDILPSLNKTVSSFNGQNLNLVNYDLIWNRILERQAMRNKQTFLGAFLDWDNTARRGDSAGIFYGSMPEKFGQYLSLQLKKANRMGSEFLFINAWNEWAEGTYLEPDKRHGYRYLEEVRRALEENKDEYSGIG